MNERKESCYDGLPLPYFRLSERGRVLATNVAGEKFMDYMSAQNIKNVGKYMAALLKRNELVFRSIGGSYGIRIIGGIGEYEFLVIHLNEFERGLDDILDISSFQHEVRNPLTVIDGTAQLMNKKSDDEFVKKCAGIISKESERIKGILKNFHILSEMEIEKKEFIIIELLNDLKDSIEMLFPKINLKIQVEQALQEVEADREKLFMSFYNILKNACESQKGEGEISLQISLDPTIKYIDKPRGQAYPMIKIIFSDNGSGMEEDVLHKLFKPFFTTKNKGTGLGLIIAREVIERHKGRIDVQSVIGAGTVFTVLIPARYALA